ncbi:MAG: carbohydrate kinase family protein [Ignavibacteria bacterium]
MKFGVIGEPCIDFIHRGESTKRCLGGVLYSVISLAVIAEPNNEIYPMMNLGTDEYENITSFLSQFNNINLNFIKKTEHKTRVVNLYYKTINADNLDSRIYDREESSTEPTLPVDYKFIEDASFKIDALLINMVSGIDITIDTLKKIRSGVMHNNYIHIDLHNIVMKTSPDGQRVQSEVENWINWCSNSDSIQMNETEIKAMAGRKLSEYEIADRILCSDNSNKPKAIVITRGRGGVTMYSKTEKNTAREKYFEIDRADLPAIERNNSIDSTGCGDVFASCFFYKNAVSNQKDYAVCLNFANRMASLNTCLIGVEELYKLGV